MYAAATEMVSPGYITTSGVSIFSNNSGTVSLYIAIASSFLPFRRKNSARCQDSDKFSLLVNASAPAKSPSAYFNHACKRLLLLDTGFVGFMFASQRLASTIAPKIKNDLHFSMKLGSVGSMALARLCACRACTKLPRSSYKVAICLMAIGSLG